MKKGKPILRPALFKNKYVLNPIPGSRLFQTL